MYLGLLAYANILMAPAALAWFVHVLRMLT
jgi:hypothetical protein